MNTQLPNVSEELLQSIETSKNDVGQVETLMDKVSLDDLEAFPPLEVVGESKSNGDDSSNSCSTVSTQWSNPINVVSETSVSGGGGGDQVKVNKQPIDDPPKRTPTSIISKLTIELTGQVIYLVRDENNTPFLMTRELIEGEKQYDSILKQYRTTIIRGSRRF